MSRSQPVTIVAALFAAGLVLAACGSSDDASPTTPADAAESRGGSEGGAGSAGGEVTDALEAGTPEATIEVPADDGATTIAEYAAGSSGYEPADPDELTQILAVVGTDATGYLTADAVVVERSKADATLLCGTVTGLGISTYAVIPVLPDGTGVDCG